MNTGTWDWKRVPRRVRDTPRLNAPITATLRALFATSQQAVPEWLATHAPRVGRATGRLPNGASIAMECREPEMVTNALFWHGWPATEPEMLPLWFAAASRASTIIDVGAHVGQHSLTAALASPQSTVIALEALPRNASALRANVRLNGCTNITVVEAAAGSGAGRARFWSVIGGLPSGSGLAEEFIATNGVDLEGTDVAVVALDSIVSRPQAPVLLKIDTETTEADVLIGARDLLAHSLPLIFLEVLAGYGTDTRIAKVIDGLDYEPYLLTAEGPRQRAEVVEDARWRNHVLAPRSGPSRALSEALGLA